MSNSDFSPYEGQVVWSTKEQNWVITVSYAVGGLVNPQEVFRGPVLANHLQRVGVKSVHASTNSKERTCLVWRQVPGDLNRHGKKLLGVLVKHYSMFKGLPVKWTLK